LVADHGVQQAAVRSQGRLTSPKEFGNIIIRALPNGAILRLTDVARIELGAQTYGVSSRYNGKPAATIAVYQLPGSNALEAAANVKKLMTQLKQSFPDDLDYAVSLDTTLAVTEGISEIVKMLFEALVLVVLVT
jgi:hydrophobic/amphiphilic exporter-1 (mainly G- bacteria), HAE1 family